MYQVHFDLYGCVRQPKQVGFFKKNPIEVSAAAVAAAAAAAADDDVSGQ